MMIPKAPADLWRTILREVTDRPDTLCMDFWHSDTRRGIMATGCGSAHCIAGWVVTVTPGGIELSRHVESLFKNTPHGNAPGLRDDVIHAADGSAEVAAALAIIYESRWQRHVTADHFFSSNREARVLLHELALLEERFDAGFIPLESPVDRTAPTLPP